MTNLGYSDSRIARRSATFSYYTNEFERTSQGWRIAKCKPTVSWMTGNYALFGGVFQ